MLRRICSLTKKTNINQFLIAATRKKLHSSSTACSFASVYEPDYLHLLKPKFPQYENINVQLKGYDYPVLESYQRFLHSLAEYLEIEVTDCYALPPQKTQVQRFRSKSAIVDAEYCLTMYERDLQINNISSPVYPIFLRLAQATLPEGVSLSVEKYTLESEEKRYVADREILELKAELEKIGYVHPSKRK